MSSGPYEISFELSYLCCLRCLMCSSDARYPSPIQNELTTEEIVDLIRQSKELGAKVISFSGGEPTLRDDIFTLLRTCHENNLHILYYTCGVCIGDDVGSPDLPYEMIEASLTSLPLKLLKYLKEIGATVIVDLQSHDPYTHDKIMGVDGVFELALETIQNCLKLGIPVETHFVPQKLNINHIEDYVYFCQELGIKKCSFLRLVPQGRAKKNYWRTMITKHQFKKMQEVFLDLTMNHNLKIDIRLGHPIDRRWQLDPENKELPIKSCRGGDQAPLILPNSEVHMCPAYKNLHEYSAGKTREKSLKDIWLNSEFYKTFRWFIKEGYRYVENECKDCPYLDRCKCGCTAQRLLKLKEITDTSELSFKEALLIAPPDPMCLLL